MRRKIVSKKRAEKISIVVQLMKLGYADMELLNCFNKYDPANTKCFTFCECCSEPECLICKRNYYENKNKNTNTKTNKET